jgi:hypothetical protein
MFIAGEARLSAELSRKQSNFFSIDYHQCLERVHLFTPKRTFHFRIPPPKCVGSKNSFMKSLVVILSILLLPGLCAHAATEQEKAFVEKYKTALETKDTATLQSCLYTTSADPMILHRDISFFEAVSESLSPEIAASQPDQIFCDAVEFYNPVHDITLPLVLRALTAAPRAEVFEVPLVYQTIATGEHYEIQRLPAASGRCPFRYHLTSQELRAKIHARDEIYLSLRDQAGPEFSAAPVEHLAIEETASAGDPLAWPHATGCELRYEWRARLLKEQGVTDEIITRAGHFIPTVQGLLAHRSAPLEALPKD